MRATHHEVMLLFVIGAVLSLVLLPAPYLELYQAATNYPENGLCIDSVGDVYATGSGRGKSEYSFPPSFTCESSMQDGRVLSQTTTMSSMPLFWGGLTAFVLILISAGIYLTVRKLRAGGDARGLPSR